MLHPHHLSLSILSAVCGIGLFAAGTVAANAACSNANLVGTYYATDVEVEARQNGTDYCEQVGTFYADGKGRITDLGHKRRCSLSGISQSKGNVLSYKVRPDCSFSVDELTPPPPAPGGTGHGMILNNGNMVLVDGTSKSQQNSMKINHVVAVRTSVKKPPVAIKKK